MPPALARLVVTSFVGLCGLSSTYEIDVHLKGSACPCVAVCPLFVDESVVRHVGSRPCTEMDPAVHAPWERLCGDTPVCSEAREDESNRIRPHSVLRAEDTQTLLSKDDPGVGPGTLLASLGKQASAHVRLSVHVCALLLCICAFSVFQIRRLSNTVRKTTGTSIGK